MPLTRNGTERPREPLLQLNVGFGQAMCRIGRRLRSGIARYRGADVEIRPFACLGPNPLRGRHRLVGSLTGVVASKRVTEASQGPLMTIGNRQESVMAQGGLTVRETTRAGAKAGHSDPVVSVWKGHRSKDKRYSGDNRLIAAKSSYRRGGLAPRCRLVTSWGWRRSQGLGCSPIKVARELGSERRETVRSLSVVGVGGLREPVVSTRGPRWTHRWCTGCPARGIAG
jgi:hypothetical protein